MDAQSWHCASFCIPSNNWHAFYSIEEQMQEILKQGRFLERYFKHFSTCILNIIIYVQLYIAQQILYIS